MKWFYTYILMPAVIALIVSMAVALTGCGPVLWRVIPHATPLF